jgi:hypothetical protein
MTFFLEKKSQIIAMKTNKKRETPTKRFLDLIITLERRFVK